MPNQPEDKRKQEETDELILKNVYFFFYAQSSSYEDDVLFDNPQTDYSMCIEDYETFLRQHFAGYLSLVKEGKTRKICGIKIAEGVDEDHYVSDARGDLFTGRKTCKRRGHKIRKNLIRKINEKKYDNNFSEVIDEIEKKNSEVLRQWDLNPAVVKKKLLKFIERMHTGTRTGQIELIEIDQKLQNTIMSLIEEQVHSGNTLESMATPITWLLLAALLRGYISGLEDYYMNMEKRPERSFEKDLAEKNLEGYEAVAKLQREINCSNRDSIHGDSICSQPRYTNPDDIRPYTMENIGNLRNTYVKRENLLKQLHQKMHGRQQNDRSGKQYVFISGIGGEGKTELARAYAYTYRNEYDEIFWFTCVDEEMPGIEKLLEGSDYSKTVTPEILHSLDERCLLILDNCNAVSTAAMRQLIKRTGKAHLLITTRLAGIAQISPQHIMFLKNDPEEKSDFACQIFAANYLAENHDGWYLAFEECEEKNDGDILSEICPDKTDEEMPDNRMSLFSAEEQENIKEICNRVSNHPMTAAIVAVMLRENRDSESINGFADKCRKGLKAAFPSYEIPFGQGEEDYDEKPENILKALFTSFPKREFTLSEKKLLTVLQMVPARQIDMKYICELLGDDEQQKEIRNACRSLCSLNWLQSNGIWITMHPLLAYVLEKMPERIWIEKDEKDVFYRMVLENWMVSASDEEWTDRSIYLGYIIWEKSGMKKENPSGLNFAINFLMNKQNAKKYWYNWRSEFAGGFTAIVYKTEEIHFLYYDLVKRQENNIYCLKKRKKAIEGLQRERVELLFLEYVREPKLDLHFPNELAGCPITEIPDGFCRSNKNVVSLELPEHLKRIGKDCFSECENISGELVLPECLTEIGEYAFYACCKMKGGLIIPGNVESISKSAFSKCGLDGELVIEEGVIEILDYAFAESRFSRCARFPESLRKIESNGFADCVDLKEIELSEGLETIGFRAFFQCMNLQGYLKLPDSVKRIEIEAFSECKNLCGSIRLPDDLEYIGANAFKNCENLSGEIVVPAKIKVIDMYTFSGCKKAWFSQRTFHNGITEILAASFSQCASHTEVLKLPEGLKKLDSMSFQRCRGVKRLELPDHLETIGAGAFYGCSDIESIELPSELKVIEQMAFSNCCSLIEIVCFPGTLEVIGKGAFAGCESLQKIADFPDSLEIIGDGAFFKCHSLTGELRFPENLNYVAQTAFYGCERLKYAGDMDGIIRNRNGLVSDEGELLVSKDTLELSGSWMRSRVANLPEKIKIPDHIIKIGTQVLSIGGVKSIDLPSSLEEIDDYAFALCRELEKISRFPPELKRIKDYAFAECGLLQGFEIFPDGLEEIGEGAFMNCTFFFDSIIIPDSIKRINELTFSKCISLREVIFSKELESIGKYAFERSGLENILFFEGLQTIEQSAFEACIHLEKVDFPKNLKKIEKSAFMDCMALKCIHFSEGLEYIGENAFRRTFAEGTLVLPASLQTIGNNAFLGCEYSQIVIKNPDMEFEDLCGNQNVVIWGYEDSTAFNYAVKNNYQFRSILEWPGIEAFVDED